MSKHQAYRHFESWDEHEEFQCLVCKNNFESVDGNISFCPKCGVKFNKFFPTKLKIQVPRREYPEYPKVVVEFRSTTNQKMHNTLFCSETTEPRKTEWHIYSHCYIGANANQFSISKLMFNKFTQCSKNYEEVRLILKYNNNDFKIIKENINEKIYKLNLDKIFNYQPIRASGI